MLRLKLKMKRKDRKIEKEIVAVANSGFVGARPQLLIPRDTAKEMRFGEILEPTIVNKKTADGRTVSFIAYPNAAYVQVIAENRTSPEILVDILIGGAIPLMNDALLSALEIVIIDAKNGIWCFLDEMGKIRRRGA